MSVRFASHEFMSYLRWEYIKHDVMIMCNFVKLSLVKDTRRSLRKKTHLVLKEFTTKTVRHSLHPSFNETFTTEFKLSEFKVTILFIFKVTTGICRNICLGHIIYDFISNFSIEHPPKDKHFRHGSSYKDNWAGKCNNSSKRCQVTRHFRWSYQFELNFKRCETSVYMISYFLQ